MKRHVWLISFLAVAAAFVAVAFVERHLVCAVCGGDYVYPLDDTYIHIAMGRNLAEHFTWGVEPDKLAFCSSSPLWTLLLGAVYCVFGVSDGLPWFLALGFNIASIFVVCRFLHARGANVSLQMAGAAGVALAGPFLPTTALGMEHAMHGFFVLAALASAFSLPQAGRGRCASACALAAAATASRYESLFLLLPLGVSVCGLEAYERWRNHRRPVPVNGIAFLVFSGLPVVLYGLWAVSQGGHFLPNSLLLKGSFHAPSELFKVIVSTVGTICPMLAFIHVLMVALAVVAVVRPTPLFWRLAAASMIIAICGQLVFASAGQLCRYEAFMMAAGAFVLIAALVEGGVGAFPLAYLSIGVCGLTAYLFVSRAIGSFRDSVNASSDICNQQVLMTKIMSDLPAEDRGCVALNDLGYMALHGGFDFVDIWGLGTQDVTERRLKNVQLVLREDVETDFSVHRVKYAVLFESWYPACVMPEGTIDVASLTLKDNHICGSDKVVFRATSEAAADRLAKHLSKYVGKMPPRAILRVYR